MDNHHSETFNTYDTVNCGTYVCMQCGNENNNGIVSIKHRGETLPECDECGYTTWIKIM